MTSALRLRAATRGSALARWQTEHVADLLTAVHPDVVVEAVVVQTTGDVRSDAPLHTIGGKGVFVKEVQAAVLDGRADLAVHSAKDLPSVTSDELSLAAVPERGDPRDALIGSTLAELPKGATVATGSIRRRAQLGHLRPDLVFAELRGNIATRLEKASGFDAIVMAVAALDRLGLDPAPCERLSVGAFVPQAGQGALAIECRAGDTRIEDLVTALNHAPTHRAVAAERAFLAELGGDCDLPAAAHAVATGHRFDIDALIAAPDGSVMLRDQAAGTDPVVLGASLAARLRDEQGGRELLGSL